MQFEEAQWHESFFTKRWLIFQLFIPRFGRFDNSIKLPRGIKRTLKIVDSPAPWSRTKCPLWLSYAHTGPAYVQQTKLLFQQTSINSQQTTVSAQQTKFFFQKTTINFKRTMATVQQTKFFVQQTSFFVGTGSTNFFVGRVNKNSCMSYVFHGIIDVCQRKNNHFQRVHNHFQRIFLVFFASVFNQNRMILFQLGIFLFFIKEKNYKSKKMAGFVKEIDPFAKKKWHLAAKIWPFWAYFLNLLKTNLRYLTKISNYHQESSENGGAEGRIWGAISEQKGPF